MNVKELIEKTGWHQIVDGADEEKEISGGYCGDLLSWVMGNGQEGQAWVTVQVHINVIGVAVLKEFSCIIIADNSLLNEDALERAKEEKLAILESKLPVYETAKILMELGI